MPIDQIHVGQVLTWLFEPTGNGLGKIYPVSVEVVQVNEKRVLVKVLDQPGNIVERWVKPEKLKVRLA